MLIFLYQIVFNIITKIKQNTQLLSSFINTESLEDKILLGLSQEHDFTYLQVKEQLHTCNFKELKKALNIIKEVQDLDNPKHMKALDLLEEIELDGNPVLCREMKNKSEQDISTKFCVIAQNTKTKEYARFVFEEEDEHHEAGYVLEFTSKRSKATEITKICESDRAIAYIEKCLTIDFPEVSWKVFKSTRMLGRDLTSYPVF